MTVAQEAQEAERRFLEELRPEYEKAGYTFISYPMSDVLPEDMGSYRPDAIAFKADKKVAIEIKSRRTPGSELSIRKIRQIFENIPDWQLRVIFVSQDRLTPSSIPRATPELVRRRLAEVSKLSEYGQRRAAFVYCWSLIEAVARIVDPVIGQRSYSPGSIIQAFAMNGRIPAEVDRELRQLTFLRNSIIHGDLEIEPSAAELDLLIDTINEILNQPEIQAT